MIGADTHKSTHTLAAVQAETGWIVATKTVDADMAGMLRAWRWSHTLCGQQRVWALEDCRHVSGGWSAAWSDRASRSCAWRGS